MPLKRYRPEIDGLRAIAVTPVVFYHAGFVGFAGGFIGVDIFFVISGFLITTIIQREISADKFTLVKFYERRARRILPAMMVVAFATLICSWFIMLPAPFEKLARSTIAATFFMSNMWFLRNSGDYFDSAIEFEPLLHTWSLSVEEQFYIFFPPFHREV